MAKVESLWLGPSIPYTVSVDGALPGEKKEFSFRLHYNFNALRLVERHTGIPLSNPFKFFESLQSVENQAILFWASLAAYQPEYTDEKGLAFVGSILNYKNCGAAIDAAFEAFLISLPDEVAEKVRKRIADNKEGKAEEEADPQTKAPAAN